MRPSSAQPSLDEHRIYTDCNLQLFRHLLRLSCPTQLFGTTYEWLLPHSCTENCNNDSEQTHSHALLSMYVCMCVCVQCCRISFSYIVFVGVSLFLEFMTFAVNVLLLLLLLLLSVKCYLCGFVVICAQFA